MSEISGDEKEKEVTPDSEAEAEKAKRIADVQDVLSRMLSKKADADADEGGDSAE